MTSKEYVLDKLSCVKDNLESVIKAYQHCEDDCFIDLVFIWNEVDEICEFLCYNEVFKDDD